MMEVNVLSAYAVPINTKHFIITYRPSILLMIMIAAARGLARRTEPLPLRPGRAAEDGGDVEDPTEPRDTFIGGWGTIATNMKKTVTIIVLLNAQCPMVLGVTGSSSAL